MTGPEWKQRCMNRIHGAVKKAGRVRVRDLKRATHYDRGPRDAEGNAGILLWYQALELLEKMKRVVVERDADGFEVAVMLPEFAGILGYDSQGKRIQNHAVRG